MTQQENQEYEILRDRKKSRTRFFSKEEWEEFNELAAKKFGEMGNPCEEVNT